MQKRTTKDFLLSRLSEKGFDLSTISYKDYPAVKTRIGWKESSFHRALRYLHKPTGNLREGIRDYVPTLQEQRDLVNHFGSFGITLLYTGCRLGEMWRMVIEKETDEQGDTYNHQLVIDVQKQGDKVVVDLDELPEPVAAAMEAWVKGADQVSVQQIRRRWKKMYDSKLFSRQCCPHAFRHLLITRAFEEKEALPMIMKMVGHRKPETTFRYFASSTKQQTKKRAALFQEV